MIAYRGVVKLIAYVTIVLGIAMIAVTASHGGGVGLILGVLFIGAGAGRLYMLRRRG